MKKFKIVINRLEDVDIEASCSWQDWKFAKSAPLEHKDQVIKMCKNTIALLEEYGEKALNKYGDIDYEFVRKNAPTDSSFPEFEIIDNTR